VSRSYLRGCSLSGCGWGAVAWVIGHQSMPAIIWGGLLASPAIGIAIGMLTRPLYCLPRPASAALMGVALYASAVLFGIASGLWDIARLPGRHSFEVVLQSLYGTLWGLTFTGYVVVLWPLAYANHRLLGGWLDQPPTTELDSTPAPRSSAACDRVKLHGSANADDQRAETRLITTGLDLG